MGDGLKRARAVARATPTRRVPKRLDVRHLRRHAERAIAARLRYTDPAAIRAVERDGDAVIIRVCSGGNALAVETYLRQRGYRAEPAGNNPDGYGSAVRVVTAPKMNVVGEDVDTAGNRIEWGRLDGLALRTRRQVAGEGS